MKKILILIIALCVNIQADYDELKISEMLSIGKHTGSFIVSYDGKEIKTNVYILGYLNTTNCISYISKGFNTVHCGDFSIKDTSHVYRYQ